MRWTNEPDLIARVNDTSTGLGGTVWSKDLDYAYRLASKIEAGTIWINGFERPLPQAYLEGHKDSGIGGEWGKHGISSYLKRKMIHHYKSSPPGAKL
jgi:acyl-CoA reductase-like NAD-dependent aldehyde dehydrogenase